MKKTGFVLLAVMIANLITGIVCSALSENVTVDNISAIAFDNGFENDLGQQLLEEALKEDAFVCHEEKICPDSCDGGNLALRSGNSSDSRNTKQDKCQNLRKIDTYDAVDIIEYMELNEAEEILENITFEIELKNQEVIFKKLQYI